MPASNKRQEFRVYRPNKNGSGAASAFQFVDKEKSYKTKDKEEKVIYSEGMLFWTMAQQTGTDANGNASFGWGQQGKHVVVKLEETDVGEILSVIRGFKASAGTDKGMFHQNATGNSVINFSAKEDNSGFYVKISAKKDKEEKVAVQHVLSLADAMVLETLLRQFLVKKYGW